MEGTIKTLKQGIGFLEENTTGQKYYFRFSDLTRFQKIEVGYQVRFEKKADHPNAPQAHKIEVLNFIALGELAISDARTLRVRRKVETG